jgi:hypothetical protein
VQEWQIFKHPAIRGGPYITSQDKHCKYLMQKNATMQNGVMKLQHVKD